MWPLNENEFDTSVLEYQRYYEISNGTVHSCLCLCVCEYVFVPYFTGQMSSLSEAQTYEVLVSDMFDKDYIG